MLDDALTLIETENPKLTEGMDENEQQAQTLTTLRDTLFPRQISGQLRLPDVGIKENLNTP